VVLLLFGVYVFGLGIPVVMPVSKRMIGVAEPDPLSNAFRQPSVRPRFEDADQRSP
jgi:hypothetical protein